MNEMEEKIAYTASDINPTEKIAESKTSEHSTCTGKKCSICKMIFNIVMVLAIIGLYLLYFFGPKSVSEDVYVAPKMTGQPGTGEVVYVNIDTINSKYLLVNILTKDIEAEMAKQEAIFANRQKSFQSKYEQFQKNYQANVLTPVQVENTQAQLMKESETLQADYEKVFGDLQARENAALKQISDSLITITKRINAKRNASFIFSYQAGGQLISADPTKDITDEVLFELNKPFKK